MHIIGIDSREHPTEVTIAFKCLNSRQARLTTPILEIRQNIKLRPRDFQVGLIHDDASGEVISVSQNEYRQIYDFLQNPMRQILMESIPVGVPAETFAYVEPKPIVRRIATNAIMELEV